LRVVDDGVVPAVNGLDAVLERSRELGFLGPGPVAGHVEHARGFAGGVDMPPQRFLDLGSGGGVPGLVLASLWPAADVTLLDAGERRCAFLTEAVHDLGWSERARIVRARAEEAGHLSELRGTFDLVVARGFGPPAVTAECGAPFLCVGGHLVVSEPPADAGQESQRWPESGIGGLGLAALREWQEPFHYQAFVLERPCPERYPRRVGVPAKRPLF
jgi:16S rRNA (guanine527-N7)-methyltransferase